MMIITGKDNPKIKELKKLRQKKYRQEFEAFIVEGEKVVREALDLNLVEELYVTDELKEELLCPTYLLSKEKMQQISSMEKAPGILARVKMNKKRTHRPEKIVVVENLRDPGNLGTIIRSAEAFGFSVGILGNVVDPWNEKTVQASMGSILRVFCDYMDYDDLRAYQKAGYSILGSRLSESNLLEKNDFPKCGILMIGNESHGLTKQAMDSCTGFLSIPMLGKVESLNAGVAASILMYLWKG